MFCPNCGARLDDGSAFCPQCGARIEPVPGQAPVPPAAPQPVQQPGQPAPQPQNVWNNGPAAEQRAWAAGAAQRQAWGAPDQQTGTAQQQAWDAPVQQPGAAASGQWRAAPQGQPAWGGAPVQPAGPQYPKGCLAQAFDDIMHIQGAMTRVMQIAALPVGCGFVAGLFALFAILSIAVPILPEIFGLAAVAALVACVFASNCANGYAIEWGRELSRGRGFDMKGKIIRQSLFSLGFFGSVVSVVLQVLAWIPLVAVALVAIAGSAGIIGMGAYSAYSSALYGGYNPMGSVFASLGVVAVLIIIFGLVSAIFSVFAQMFGSAAVMHLGVTGRVESAFDVKGIWKAVKPQMGKLFCASVLPGWIVVGVSCAVRLLLGLLSLPLAFAFGSAPEMSIVGAAVMQLIVMLVSLFLGTFAIVLTQRAMGHWAARYAPEWADEGKNDLEAAA